MEIKKLADEILPFLLKRIDAISLRSLIIICMMTSGCYKNHLYVQQEWVDHSFLASSHVDTPDPRQEEPMHGERLLIGWKFPNNLFSENLDLVITVRFWDLEEEQIFHKIKKSWGHLACNFFTKNILTYQVQVYNKQGELISNWQHHFWTRIIDVDRMSVSVSSQPRQASVMETPY